MLSRSLINRIESGLGCRIGIHWYGGLAYADDVILLSTSVQGLQELVNICQEHAKESDLQFSTHPNPNLSKTVCIVFNSPNNDSQPHWYKTSL